MRPLELVAYLQDRAGDIMTKWAGKLNDKAADAVQGFCDSAISFLVNNFSQKTNTAQALWDQFETMLDALIAGYVQGSVSLLTVASGVTQWIEYVRSFVA